VLDQNKASHQRRLRKVRKALFEVARVAAEAVASNQKLLQALKQKRLNAITQIAGRTGGIAASAWTFFSAFTFTTEVTGASVAPLSTWLTSGPLVLETTTFAACANPLMALTALAITIYHLDRARRDHNEKVRLEGQVERYEYSEYFPQSPKQCACIERWLIHLSTLTGKILVICAWSVASDTEMMLGWVRCTKAIDPGKYLTADAVEETPDKMKDIIKQYKEMVKAPRQKKEKFVRGYLKRQRETLISIQKRLREVPESDDDSSLYEDSH
jgi:hypothetical protein